MNNIIDINSEAAIKQLSEEARIKIDTAQKNLCAIRAALVAMESEGTPENKSIDPFDLLTFSREDAREVIADCVAKL